MLLGQLCSDGIEVCLLLSVQKGLSSAGALQRFQRCSLVFVV